MSTVQPPSNVARSQAVGERPLTGGLDVSFSPNSSRYISHGWGRFIARYTWDWFVTLTFVGSLRGTDRSSDTRELVSSTYSDVHPERAEKLFRLWVSMLNREVYGRRWWKRSPKGVRYIVGVEWQRRGIIHCHALLAGVEGPRGLADWRVWKERWKNLDPVCGIARIEVPHDSTATANYVAKYVAKGGDIKFSDNLGRLADGYLPLPGTGSP